MKLIDEKGRLFGKINVIDFLVILSLISLTPMLYYGYKIFNAPLLPQKQVYIKIRLDSVIPEIYRYLKNITLEIDALCHEEGGQYLFNGRPVRLGSSFTFQNENYEIRGVVIEISRKS